MSDWDKIAGQVKQNEREIRRLRVDFDKIATPSGGVRATSIVGTIPGPSRPVEWYFNANLLGLGDELELCERLGVWISASFAGGRAYYAIGAYCSPPCGGGGGGASGTVAWYGNGAWFCDGVEADFQDGAGVWISGACVAGRAVYTIGVLPFQYVDLIEIAPPGLPAANNLRLYVEDFKGFSFFSFVDDTGMRRKIVRDSVFVGRAAEILTAGQAVYASGSTGNVPWLSKAKADALATMPAIGIVLESVAANAFARVMQVGLIENINTNAFAEGNVLFVDATTAGALTATAPLYPNIRQEVGTVLVKSVGAGAMQVVARSMMNEGILDHGGLLGLGHNDHPQYISGVDFFKNGGPLCWGDGLDLVEGVGVWISGGCVLGVASYEIGAYCAPPCGGGGGVSGTVSWYLGDMWFCDAVEAELEPGSGIWISGTCEGGDHAKFQIGAYASAGAGDDILALGYAVAF